MGIPYSPFLNYIADPKLTTDNGGFAGTEALQSIYEQIGMEYYERRTKRIGWLIMLCEEVLREFEGVGEWDSGDPTVCVCVKGLNLRLRELSALIIQDFWKRMFGIKKRKKKIRAILLIQAVWRFQLYKRQKIIAKKLMKKKVAAAKRIQIYWRYCKWLKKRKAENLSEEMENVLTEDPEIDVWLQKADESMNKHESEIQKYLDSENLIYYNNNVSQPPLPTIPSASSKKIIQPVEQIPVKKKKKVEKLPVIVRELKVTRSRVPTVKAPEITTPPISLPPPPPVSKIQAQLRSFLEYATASLPIPQKSSRIPLPTLANTPHGHGPLNLILNESTVFGDDDQDDEMKFGRTKKNKEILTILRRGYTQERDTPTWSVENFKESDKEVAEECENAEHVIGSEEYVLDEIAKSPVVDSKAISEIKSCENENIIIKYEWDIPQIPVKKKYGAIEVASITGTDVEHEAMSIGREYQEAMVT
ncbi:hypothetical protein HK098_006944 [Nowakowskiella sp. JEL0407]|nr:hypothetical protein HK098_006944 [Nowakowskiella sp. JEL0407]